MPDLQYLGNLSLESFNQKVIDETIEKCSKTHNPRILEAIKQSWIENLNKRLNSVKTQGRVVKPKLSKSVREVLEKDKEEEKPQTSEDDEFLDADVVSADNSSSSPSPQIKPEDPKPPEITLEKEDKSSSFKGETGDEYEDPDTDVSISEISDLDDEEPETNDLVIGMLEKVMRPTSKKFGAPLWKVKLKYGIMQINNVEIPFDTLNGEFEF